MDRASQMVLHLAHVLDDLITVLRHGGAADALPDADARVVSGRRAGPEHKGIPIQQIDTAPVPGRMRLVYPPHDLVQDLAVRRAGRHERLHLGSQIFTKPRLLAHRWNPSVYRTSPTNDNPAPERNLEAVVCPWGRFAKRPHTTHPRRRRIAPPRRWPPAERLRGATRRRATRTARSSVRPPGGRKRP